MCGSKNLGYQKKCNHCNLFFCNNCFAHHMNVFPCSNKLKMNVRLNENKDKSKDKITASSNQYNCAICRKSINLINNEKIKLMNQFHHVQNVKEIYVITVVEAMKVNS